MKFTFFILLVSCLALTAASVDTVRDVDFPKADIRDVLRFYEILSGKPARVAPDVEALVTIVIKGESSRAAAIELIRKTLLERYGIELRPDEQGEVMACWSKDPKYPHRSDPPMTEEEKKSRDPKERGRLRIISPAKS